MKYQSLSNNGKFSSRLHIVCRLGVRLVSAKTWLLLVFAMVLGCGGSQCTVTGTLSFNGQPIQDGSIRFFPVDGTEGPGAVAKIENGQYGITSESNLLAGKYSVQITAVKKTGRMIRPREVMPGDAGTPTEEEIQLIPAKYNSESELRADLHAGENTYDQEL